VNVRAHSRFADTVNPPNALQSQALAVLLGANPSGERQNRRSDRSHALSVRLIVVTEAFERLCSRR
jgi:hypothetical protein